MEKLLRLLLCVLLASAGLESLQAQCDATFAFDTGTPPTCTTDPVTFTSNANPGDVDTYFWTFGDGTTSDQANPVHTYPFTTGSATYPVTLTITLDDSAGTQCSTTQNVTVNGGPVIFASVDSVLKCNQNAPNDTIFSPTFTINPASAGLGPFTWDFGNGQTITSPNLTQTVQFDCFGTYNVTITAAGSTCPGYQQQILFYTNPVTDIVIDGPPVVCEGQTICVANNTDAGCGNVEYYLWDWGIYGNAYTVPDTATQCFTFDLNLNGNPTTNGLNGSVSITAFNGCFSHNSTTQITIEPGPDANFIGPDTLCMPMPIATFTNLTTPDENYIFDPTTYVWDFGDGSPTTTIPDPIHDYTAAGPGVYTVTLLASNGCGTSAFTRDIVIVAPPVASFVMDTAQGCAPICIGLTNLSTPDTLDAIMYWDWNVISDSAWSFDAGSAQGDFEPTFCFGAPDSFAIILEARNLCGTSYDTAFLDINISPRILLDTLPDSCGTFVLDSLSYLLEDFGAPISNYTWTTTGVPATASGPTLPQVVFAPGQTHTITLSVENDCGITSASTSFTLDPDPVVDAGNDTTICINDTGFQLIATPDTGFWTGTGIDSAGNFVPTSVGTVELIFTHFANRCLAYDTVLITVVDTPAVVARQDTAFCLDSSVVVTLTATPVGGTWVGPNLLGSNQFRGDTAGTFVFTYFFTDSTGCEGSDEVIITVNGLPEITLIDTIFYCLTNTAQPLPTPTVISPAGGSGIWSGPGVSDPILGLFTPSLLGGPDTVEVFYTFTTDSGCETIEPLVVEVISADSVAAGPLDTLCFNVGLDTLTGFFPNGGVWAGLGVIGTGPVINTTSMNVGPNMLIYTFAPGTSCEASDTTFIEILDTTALDIGPQQNTCEDGTLLTLTANVPGGTWTGLGIIDPANGIYDPTTVVPGTNDLVTYSFTNADGCTSRDDKIVFVDSLPTALFALPGPACIGDVVSFANGSIHGTGGFQWDFGDGSAISTLVNPTHIYAVADTYTVQLIAETSVGCRDTLTSEIEISEPPSASFIQSADSGCAPLSVTFNNISNGAGGTYFWDFGNGQTDTTDGSPTIVFQGGTDDTTYVITLTVANRCDTVTFTDSVKVFPLPIVTFGPATNSGCSIFPVDFNNTTSGGPNTYNWYQNEISTDSLFYSDSLPPTQFYSYSQDTGSALFDIILVATNSCGSDTGVQTIEVFPNTIDAFFNTNPTQGCEPLTVDFLDLSGAPFIGWDIDGTQPTVPDPSYTFTQPGTYTVLHYANNGCSYDTNSITVTVFPRPDVSFVADTNEVCQGGSISFTNTSLNTTGYNWTFGDGNGTSLINPTHIFDTAGTYTVILTALSDTNACPNSDSMVVTVNPPPPISFTLSDTAGCPPLTVQTGGTPPNLSYIWDFGDGSSPVVQRHPSHTYTQTGLYTLTLTVSNNEGCQNDSSAQVRVFPVPTVGFSTIADTFCGANTVIDFTSSASPLPLQHYWDLGGIDTAITQDVAYSFDSTGVFPVELLVTNIFGCEDSLTRDITVLPQPVANASSDIFQGCAPLTVAFADSSIGNGSRTWLIDGQTFTSANLTYTFNVPDTVYQVILLTDTADFCFDADTINIITASPPDAAFTPSFDVACFDTAAGFNTVVFTNQTTSTLAVSFIWDFGDGDSAFEPSPTHDYTQPGVYIVRLTATNIFDCADVFEDTITIHPQPVAQIGVDTTQGCVPLLVNFSDLTTNSSNRMWIVDGDTLFAATFSYSFPVADTSYTVYLMVDTAGFCSSIDSVVINTASPPEALFSASEVNSCFDTTAGFNTIVFTNQTTSTLPATYVWDFGDGNSSTDVNPSHDYTQPGVYVVILTATNSFNCVDIYQETVTVYPQPAAQIGVDTTQGCVPLLVNFSDLSTNSSNRMWIVGGDTLFAATFSYSFPVADTSYTVYLMVDTAGFCSSIDSVVINTASPPEALFSASEVNTCFDTTAGFNTIVFTNQTTSTLPATYFWDFGDGNNSTDVNPSHDYTQPGVYVVILTATNSFNCVDVYQDTVTVYPQPAAQIAVDTTQGCVPLLVNFSDLSTNSSNRLWIVDGDTLSAANFNYTFTVPDTAYTVYLFADTAGFCTSVDSVVITTASLPNAAFVVDQDQFCDAPATVQFTNQSSATLPITYEWSFGDGNGSVVTDPAHVYNSVAHFPVMLVATNTFGCRDTATDTIYVYPQVQAGFIADTLQGCVPFAVNFTDQSVDASGWNWTIDGNIVLSQNPSYVFIQPDTSYEIVLIADTADFCFDTARLTIDVATPPLANFSMAWDEFCDVPALNTFTDLSQSTRPLFYEWTFGDGDSSVIPSPNHVYNQTGEYVISQVIVNDYGCRDTLTDTVNVYPQPEAILAADPDTWCAPMEVNFTNLSTGYGNSVWDFGDQSPLSSDDNPVHTYFAADTSFTVTLTVDTAGFCFDDTTYLIRVGSFPTADFTPSLTENCGPTSVDFVNLSSTADLPLSYVWDFGNGDQSSLENPSVSYDTPGDYEVTLFVRNSYGCPDSNTQTIRIIPQPEALFGAVDQDGCQPFEAVLFDLSANANEWSWTLGDGNSATGDTVVYTYADIGTYDVQLIAGFDGECFDTLEIADFITVYATPIADFLVQDSIIDEIPDGTVTFTNLSQPATNFFWDLGDGTTTTVVHPVHRYFVNGTYTVELIAQLGECFDTTSQEIMPFQFGNLHIPNAMAPNAGAGEYAVFFPKGVGLEEYHIAIYSTWGDLIWESTALQDGVPTEFWDGTINGRLVSQDVFVWKVHEARFVGGREWNGPREGSVTVIR